LQKTKILAYLSDFPLSQTVETGSGGPNSLLFNGNWGYFPGVKRPEGDVDHSPPYTTEVRKEWIYTSTSHLWFHSVGRDNFLSLNCLFTIKKAYTTSCGINI
jgi:hypothetical protein